MVANIKDDLTKLASSEFKSNNKQYSINYNQVLLLRMQMHAF